MNKEISKDEFIDNDVENISLSNEKKKDIKDLIIKKNKKIEELKQTATRILQETASEEKRITNEIEHYKSMAQ